MKNPSFWARVAVSRASFLNVNRGAVKPLDLADAAGQVIVTSCRKPVTVREFVGTVLVDAPTDCTKAIREAIRPLSSIEHDAVLAYCSVFLGESFSEAGARLS